MTEKFEVINEIIKGKGYKSYLELGIGTNRETYPNVICENKTGVDIVFGDFSANIIQTSTDDFFQSNTNTFDVIYIDASHDYSNVCRDFDNAVKFLNKGGVILMHDVGPMYEKDTSLDASGTAFKKFIEIRGDKNFHAWTHYFLHNNDVLGIVQKKKNKSILTNYAPEWNYYDQNKALVLNSLSITDTLKEL